MMGLKAVEPKLYLSFSLGSSAPANHLVRRIAGALDFDFVRSLVHRRYSHTGQPSVDPVVPRVSKMKPGIFPPCWYVAPDGDALEQSAADFARRGLTLPGVAVFGLAQGSTALAEAVVGSPRAVVIHPRR